MANKTSFPETLTNQETPDVGSPVAGRGRGTLGGGGKKPSAPHRAQMVKALQMGAPSIVLKKPGCGKKTHDDDCLCDVAPIANPTPIGVSFPHDITFASLICEHLGYEAPYTTAQVLEVLQMAARSKDLLDGPKSHEHKWRENQKVPHEAREFMRECAEQGMRNRDVIAQVEEHWGITISQAYISKRRYLYTGQRGTSK